jgi:hypothetical protein
MVGGFVGVLLLRVVRLLLMAQKDMTINKM